ncbi:lipopolysaccharide biosynthesis protein [Sediminibacterium sp. C3]|uniref:exopolysaccharide transport family protein n=1 Tax=Sediminibacterium sp. C3 TaxID=1267211 RepID=UPI001268752C|nr:lipopolysaccharide biosynthesis protein [Sediminibacterium sp. C3]
MIAVFITYFLVRKLPDTFKSRSRISTGLVDQSQQFLETNKTQDENKISQQFSNLIEMNRLKRIFDQVSFQLMIHDLTSDKPFRPPSKLLNEIGPEARAHALDVFKKHIVSKEPLSLFDKDQFGINQLLISMGYDEPTLQKKIIIYRVNNSDFIDFEYESENPFLSAFVINTLISEFVDFYGNYIKGNQQKAVNFLDMLMKKKFDSMTAKMRLLRDYKIRNRVLNLNEQAKSLYNQIADYESRLQVAQKDVEAYQGAIRGIESKFSPQDRRYLESVVVDVNQSVIATRDRLRQVTNDLVKSNFDPRIKEKQDSLRSELEGKILESTDRLLVSPLANKQLLVQQKLNLEIALDQARSSIDPLSSELRRLNEKFDMLVPHEALIQSYEGSVDVAGKEYLDIQNRFNQTSLESSMTVQLRQIEMAMPGPAQPSKKLLLVALAGIISFVFCLAALFVIFYLDDSIQNASELANKTNLPVLAYLPYINTSMLDLTNLWKNGEGNRITIAFKNLLRSLRFEVEREMGNKKLLAITSLTDGEGKTLISLGLAYAYSMVNKRVLVIDGNFDQPTITETTGTNTYLEDYLKNRITLGEIIKEGKISVLGNRGGDTSIFEFCDESIVKPKLTYLRDVFDIIIIEAPSMDKLNKSREWVVLAEKVVAIYAAGTTIKNGKNQSVQYLYDLGDQFAGWALNKVIINRLNKIPK